MLETNRLEAFFKALSDQARAAQVRERHALDAFFSHYQYRKNIWAKYKRETDYVIASDFNVFSVLSRTHDENAISATIAELLRPSGAHGQQETFLRLFLEHLRHYVDKAHPDHDLLHANLSLDAFDKFHVKTEHVTDMGRRIDLWIETDTKFIIAIENKIFAQDQQNQLHDYWRYLETLKRDFILIYLTLDGKDPSEESLPNDLAQEVIGNRVILLSHAEFVVPWLQDCVTECKAMRVRFFLEDLIGSLGQSILTRETLNGHDAVSC
ncbi:MAG TPA: PD-(D/E)XK nuclease family protein [Solidesulfovibrio magneticus]|nr:PD-(D/E)XK nuclease family protein [Solidesulfovibrio magneticus]